ncbi:MAG: TolB family protein, partial [Planctomycetota bacterium]
PMSCKGNRGLHVAALFVAAAALRGDSCTGNLGENEPGPVTFRLSVSSGSGQADGESGPPSVSADGRFVAFSSKANNLASGSVGLEEVYVRDRALDVVINVSRLADIREPSKRAPCINPALSADGRFVVFQTAAELDGTSNPWGTENLFVRNMTDGSLRRVANTWPDASLEHPVLSGDGRYVAFESAATNLGTWNTNSVSQVYVADLNVSPATIILVSRSAASSIIGANANARSPHISEDGSAIVFVSRAGNLHADVPSSGPLHVYRGWPWGDPVELVSRESGVAGTPFDRDSEAPFVNANATHVAFVSIATNLGATGPAVYLRQLGGAQATTQVASDPFVVLFPFGPGLLISFADRVALSQDAELLVYTRMVPGVLPTDPPEDLQIIVRDLVAGSDRVVSVGPVGGPGNGFSFSGMLSSDGRWAFFQSIADNLVLGDTNGVADVFGHGPLR